MRIEECPRFSKCNAPICPLADKRSWVYLLNESTCFYVREFVKEDTKPLNDTEVTIWEIIEKNLPDMLVSGGSHYRQAIKKASKSRSKRNLAEKLSRTLYTINSRGMRSETTLKSNTQGRVSEENTQGGSHNGL